MLEIKTPKLLMFWEKCLLHNFCSMTNQKVRHLMVSQIGCNEAISVLLIIFLTSFFLPLLAAASDTKRITAGNFGLPGIIDLPTARRFPEGELAITQQLHKSLARSGISFQALPRVSLSFHYTGHGINGDEAYGRINHDRSFDAHFFILDEAKYLPAISVGLRDFIGTGWYSSEYIVGTKLIGSLELTAGLGFGRLAERNAISNPLGALSSRFDQRDSNNFGYGGTLGTINWFKGEAAPFYGIQYHISEKLTVSSEYTPDTMWKESSYLDVNSPWNFEASYQLNDYVNLSAQYLHGSQVSLTGQVSVNPSRPPFLGGKELAPVPMRLRGNRSPNVIASDEKIIRKVLAADEFEINYLIIQGSTVKINVTNTKFRSISQAVGRVASTLQRFTSDTVKNADISFQSHGLVVANYHVDLEKITEEQFKANVIFSETSSIVAKDLKQINQRETSKRISWGLGPYVTHRLFNPDLPFSMEAGLELEGAYHFSPGVKLSGAFRKSILTNLTDNKQRSNSPLPRVHSDWPLYDLEGQNGHIHELKLSYVNNLAPSFYGRMHAGLLEPFFAGIGGEILFKPAKSSVALGIDIHRVRKREYDMMFKLRDYETTVGHLSVYYDAGGLFDLEFNAGRYLAGDWGTTTTISRRFGSGWEVGAYATLTDVPFDTFGEGSFDKAIYVSIPMDWITATPNKIQRSLTLRPITRDGGANLGSARSLYRLIKRAHHANFKREFGRLWK